MDSGDHNKNQSAKLIGKNVILKLKPHAFDGETGEKSVRSEIVDKCYWCVLFIYCFLFQYEIFNIVDPAISKKQYMAVSKQKFLLPPLPSANHDDSNMASCRYHCGYDCKYNLMFTHQQVCGGRPRYEMEHMPGMKFNYTCNICQRSCGRMFEMLKHFKFSQCLPEIPPLQANKRKREWPITLVIACCNCETICSTKYNVNRHFARNKACERQKQELVALYDSAKVKEQIDIEEMIDFDPMANQPIQQAVQDLLTPSFSARFHKKKKQLVVAL